MKDDRIIAVDCSLRLTCVALMEDGRVVSSDVQDLGRRQAAELPLMAERLIERMGWAWGDVGLVAVGRGPGYFTGIRVGVAWASALAYGVSACVVPVSSLEMLAASSGERGEILTVVYAGRGAVYAASFGASDAMPEGERGAGEIAAWLAQHEGAAIVSDDPERASRALELDLPMRTVRPDPARLAELAWARRGDAVSPFEVRPSYCRAPQGT